MPPLESREFADPLPTITRSYEAGENLRRGREAAGDVVIEAATAAPRALGKIVTGQGSATDLADLVMTGIAPEMKLGAAALGKVLPAAIGAIGKKGARAVEKAAADVVLTPVEHDPFIKAYHGSPYDFERFDTSKIGTGEGAQSYGRGLYFAENPKVAEEYKRVQRKAPITKSEFDLAKASGLPLGRGRTYEVAIKSDPEHFLDWDKPLKDQPPKIQEAIAEAAKKLKRSGLFTTEPERTLRETRQERLANPDTSGEEIYSILARGFSEGKGSDQRAATEVLKEAGIPGIRYLDQGSRPVADAEELARMREIIALVEKQTGPMQAERLARLKRAEAAAAQALERPTRNYVVFDDKTINILKKYGMAGLIAGGGAATFATTPVDHDPFTQ